MKEIHKQHFIAILEKYRLDQATAEEISFLETYYNVFDLNEDLITADNEQYFSDLKARIRLQVEEEINPKPSPLFRTSWFRYAAAAMVVLSLSIGAYFYLQSPQPVADSASTIYPGSNKAVLTLADGKKIVLDDAANGAIGEFPGISISKTADGELIYTIIESDQTEKDISSTALHTISTPRAGQYQVVLPDGTHVWLNAATSLSYPSSFKGNSRTVNLKGEAYFEVAKNKNMPFIIKSGVQTVEVLGTHFNVNAYENEQDIRTTLIEGAVKVSVNGSQSVLAPGQQARVSYSQPGKINVQNVDINKEIAWKNGVFAFEADDLQTVMRQIERWYNVDVTYSGKPCEEKFYGEISRNDKLSDVFKILEINNVHFEVKGKTINVTCN